MEQLWSPWRKQYILHPKTEECIFCNAIRDSVDRHSHIIHRGRRVFVMLNRYPYNNGHMLVAPVEHRARLSELDSTVRAELMEYVERSIRLLDRVMNPHGYNVGMNSGRIAGAGIEDHLHFHVVPRWNGDTNFMPVCGETRVINELLEETWQSCVNHVKDIFQSKEFPA
jgi:ATP adenylyltransferase